MRANDREGISIRANDHEGISIRAKHKQGKGSMPIGSRVVLAITRAPGDDTNEISNTDSSADSLPLLPRSPR